MSVHPEYKTSNITVQSHAKRHSKVHTSQLALSPQAGASFTEFIASLPDILAGRNIRLLAQHIVQAHQQCRAIVIACGGHVVKCGLAPVLITLMRHGFITALAVNGAVAIHDAEIALFGATSEDVTQGLQTGTFGMAAETALFYNEALRQARSEKLGGGEALGRAMVKLNAPHQHYSLLATAYQMQIPLTVHSAIGTDIVHMHPSADGAAIGEASLRDFHILTAAMRDLAHGGVLLNIGSAVLLPEVLLKAIALLRNESLDFTDFLGVNMDFMQQYRAEQQVVARVRAIGGEGISLTGHHEIMLPLLAHAILEAAQENET